MRTDPRMQRDAEPSLGTLIRSLLSDLGQLVRTEIRLAQAEVGRNLSRTRRPLAMIAVGAVLMFGALLTLIGALVALLAPVLGVALAALLVAAIVAGGGIALILNGRTAMKRVDIVPARTVASVKQDAQALKGRGQ